MKFTQAQVDAYNRKQGFISVISAARASPVPRTESPLEARFLELWNRLEGPPLVREARLIPDRKFRVDFLHEASKTVIELNGFKDHTSWKGFARDNFKFLQLALLGYQVITLDKPLITEENVDKLIALVESLSRFPQEA